MNQREAVIEAMKLNGGYATLGTLYKDVMKLPDVKWGTRTPFASIRRIVQKSPQFFRIRPGLWALKDARKSIPPEILLEGKITIKEQDRQTHSYYQGLITEIGNMKRYKTAVPAQDKNNIYLQKPLKSVASLDRLYEFGYPHLVRKASTVDVIWFNNRMMPEYLFEVEHSTDFRNSLLKFAELQDFHCTFNIVSHAKRERQFKTVMGLSSFSAIADRVLFLSYERVAQWHSGTSILYLVGKI